MILKTSRPADQIRELPRQGVHSRPTAPEGARVSAAPGRRAHRGDAHFMVEKAFCITSQRDDAKEISVILNVKDATSIPIQGKYAERFYVTIDKIQPAFILSDGAF